ncbi:IS5 family transposase [Methylorubrum populi]|uniref:Mobile element protein n=1 Tax=Methylorubrum populi TaxID=223967 RepID=A0A833MW11_9HYPH|nr:IS5 family transposase [Methylorubrum populi]KAB7783837.1 Mobile element protein [Methylorubrum populi]
MPSDRRAYPSDVSDEEWALVAPYLALLREDSAQRDHELREVFNGLRYVVKSGCPWRFMPHDLPPWAAVYQQTQRWLAADCFAAVAGDLRAVLRMAAEREPEPSAVILDSRTLRSSPESGERAGSDGAKRKRGSKVHLAVDTPGHVVALHVTPADVDDRAEVGRLSATVQAGTQDSVELAFVDQGYSGPKPAAAASAHGIALEVVKAPEAKRGFVLLPRRWVVERSFAWATRCRRLVKDYERYASTLSGLHMVAFVCLMLRQGEKLMTSA